MEEKIKVLESRFDGEKLVLYNIDGSFVLKQQNIETNVVSYDAFLNWKKNPRERIIGRNFDAKPIIIRDLNGLIEIGCMKDTPERLDNLVKEIKLTIIKLKNERKRSKS